MRKPSHRSLRPAKPQIARQDDAFRQAMELEFEREDLLRRLTSAREALFDWKRNLSYLFYAAAMYGFCVFVAQQQYGGAAALKTAGMCTLLMLLAAAIYLVRSRMLKRDVLALETNAKRSDA